MNIATRTLGGLLIGGLAILGCEKAEDTPVTTPEVNKAVESAGAAAADAGAAVKATADDAVKAVTEQAQKLYDQAKQYIDEKKFDEAAKTLTSLEGLKSKLPADWAAKVDELSKMLDTAKKAVGGAAAPAQ